MRYRPEPQPISRCIFLECAAPLVSFIMLGFWIYVGIKGYKLRNSNNKHKISMGIILFCLIQESIDYINRMFLDQSYTFTVQKDLPFLQFCQISFYFSFGFEGVIFALVLSYVPSIWIIITEFKNSRIDFSLLKPRKGFIINNYGINLSNAISAQIDKIIIAPILGFELLGNYALALQFFVVLMMLANIVFKYLLTQESSGKNTQRLKNYTILLSIAIAVFGIIVIPKIIPILFPKFISSIDAIQIISLSVIPSTIALIYESKFLALEKSKFLVISKSIATIIIVFGFLTLGLTYQMIGLATTLLLAASFQAIFLFICNKILEHNQA